MNGKSEIDLLLASVKRPCKCKKPYVKPQSIRDFEQQYKSWYYANRSTPDHVQSMTQFRDDSANELTKLIMAYIKVHGGFASRLNSMGVYRGDLCKFVRSTQRRGMSDVIGTYQGKSLNIEVKIGADKMSIHQIRVKNEIRQAGGFYFVAKDFDSFQTWFKQL